jgi:hypothetical protein
VVKEIKKFRIFAMVGTVLPYSLNSSPSHRQLTQRKWLPAPLHAKLFFRSVWQIVALTILANSMAGWSQLQKLQISWNSLLFMEKTSPCLFVEKCTGYSLLLVGVAYNAFQFENERNRNAITSVC